VGIIRVSKHIFKSAAFAAALLFCLPHAYAQQGPSRPGVEVKSAIGYSNFGDDLASPHLVVGGSLRVYFTKRWSVEPEILYMRGSGTDHDIVPSINVAFDLRDATKKNFVPYLIAGKGFLYHWNGERGGIEWRSGSFGAGVRTRVSDRLSVFADARLGAHPYVRATFGVGYTISGVRKRD
jgi:hypothetical protein